MCQQWKDSSWVSAGTRDALVRALGARRHSRRSGHARGELGQAFERLCAEATAAARPPEAVLQVFRSAWDSTRLTELGDDPRGLPYYGTLGRCLDACFSRPKPDAERAGTPMDIPRRRSDHPFN